MRTNQQDPRRRLHVRANLVILSAILISLLAGSGTSAMARADTRTTSLKPVLSIDSTRKDAPDAKLNEKLGKFNQYLEGMQQELAIPGMSVAIVKDQELLWAQGFGYADVEAGRPAA